jgi:Ser/Thr protein kinase RdoA (MazF antagonist)
MIPTFVMLRRLLLTAWIGSHAETPTAQDVIETHTDGTLSLADDFLSKY